MVQVRLNASLSREALPAISVQPPRVGVPKPHRRDILGRNWDSYELQHGRGHFAAFRAIVEELRLEYDLVTPDHL